MTSESPVRATSALAIYSWLGLPAVGGSGRAHGKLKSVERGGPVSGYECGHVVPSTTHGFHRSSDLTTVNRGQLRSNEANDL